MCNAAHLPSKGKGSDSKGSGAPKRQRNASLRQLYRFASKTDRWQMVAGVSAVVVSGANQPLQLVVFGQLLDSFNLTDKSEVQRRIFFLAGMYAALGVQQLITISIQTACFTTVAARQSLRMRAAYFAALARRPLSFFDGADAGGLASSVLEKTTAVQAGLGDDLAQLLQRLVAFVTGLACALYFSWQLALVSTAAVPLLALCVKCASGAYSRATAESALLLDQATSTPLEAVSAVRTVQAYGLQRRFLARYAELATAAAAQGKRLGRAKAALEATIAPIMFLMFGSALWFGSKLVSDDMEAHEYCRFVSESGELQDPDGGRCETGGDIMTAFLSVLFGFLGLLQALPSLATLAAARTAAAAILDVIDAPPDPTDALAGTGAVPPSGRAAGRIELVEVSFAYPARRDVQVYQGLSLTIEPGATVALAGPSGCGKSTLVALLERWYDVDGGRVVLDGADVRSLSVRWLRSQIGLVSQEPVLFNGTIAYNIGLGAAAAGEGGGEGGGEAAAAAVEVAARQANAHAFVSAMPDGYATEVGDKGVQLSGGQKQRIAIARALVRDPPILVLDEATSALDAESERIVQAALDELLRAQRRTTIVIAHRLSTIRNADKIAVVSGGRVVEEGPHDELVDREGGIYRSLVLHNNAGRVEL